MNKSGFVEIKHSALEILSSNMDTVLIKYRVILNSQILVQNTPLLLGHDMMSDVITSLLWIATNTATR